MNPVAADLFFLLMLTFYFANRIFIGTVI